MSETLMKLVVDCSTGEEQYIPLTVEEIAEREAQAQIYAEQQAILEAEATAKEANRLSGIAALKKLGLTDAQIDALLN